MANQKYKPNVPEAMAVEFASRIYGLDVTSMKTLVSYDDQNYHIKVSKQHRNSSITEVSELGYTLKIVNAGKSNRIEEIHKCLEHMHQKGLSVPRPVQNLDGGTWKMEEVPIGVTGGNIANCGIHLLTYISGVPVSTVPYTPQLLFQWGLLLAKCHNALEDFTSESLHDKILFWDLQHVPDLVDFMEGLNEERKRLVMGVLDKFAEEITPCIDKLPKGVIHGDFNETNILVETLPDGSFLVNGILDLEDLQYGSNVWDLGLTLAYTLLDCEDLDPLEGSGHALAGYLSLRKITSWEISLLKICMESRLCQSLVMGEHNVLKDPSNHYLNHSSRTGWKRLEQICGITNEELLKIWNKILQLYK